MKMTLEQAIEQKREYLQKLHVKQESARLSMIEAQASVGMATIGSILWESDHDLEAEEKFNQVLESGVSQWVEAEQAYTRLQRGIEYQAEELKILEKKMEVSK